MWRDIKTCLEMIKALDKNTKITLYFLRTIAKQHLVDTLVVGKKVLIEWNSLKQYLKLN